MAQAAPSLEPPMASSTEDGGDKDEEPDPAEDNGGIHLTPSAMDITAVLPIKPEITLPKLTEEELYTDIVLPKVTYDDARRLMTRTDFFDGLDHDNVRLRDALFVKRVWLTGTDHYG